jgi:hypothetical protein
MIKKLKRIGNLVARASRPCAYLQQKTTGGTPVSRAVEALEERMLFSAPEVIFDIRNSANGSHTASVTSAGQVVSMDLLVLVGGNDANHANDAPNLIQFSVQSGSGGLLGNVNVSLAAPYNDSIAGNVPTPADYDGDGDTEVGIGAGATGSSSDTAIASVFTNPFSTSEAAKLGEETIGGAVYSKFKIGTATFTVNPQTLSTGQSTAVSFILRTGTPVIRPEKFWLDNTSATTSLQGNDPAIGQATPVTISVPAPGNTGGNPTPTDTTPPTAAIAAPIANPGADTAMVDFAVNFSDDTAINVASITNGDVTIAGPNGFSENAILLSTSGSGQNVTGNFQALGPNGIFSAAANGHYTISLNAGSVTDTSGNGVAGAALGGFDVNVAQVAPGPNLSGTVLNIPKTIAPSSKKNKITFRVANTGTNAFSGNVAVKVYASASGQVDKKSIVLIPNATLAKLNLAAGAGKNFTLAFNAPAKTLDAQYHLIVVLDPANKITEQFKSDNTLVSPTTVRLAGPTVDLSPALLGVPANIARKKRTAINVKITNSGNVTAKGAVKIQLFAIVGAKQVQIASLSSGISLTALASKVFKLTADASKVSAGNHLLRAVVTFAGSPRDSVAANNSVTSGAGVSFV